jgi:uncharacterized protein (UPF0335 family)
MNVSSTISAQELKNYIEKIERLETEKEEVTEQIKEVMAQAKGDGFDVKIMKQIIKMRKMKKEDLLEQQELLDLYKEALGMHI